MRKFFTSLLFCTLICTLFACGSNDSISTSESESHQESVSISACEHRVTKILEKPSTCSTAGNIEFYFCIDCQTYFSDALATMEISYDQTRLEKAPHKGEKVAEIPATCGEYGVKEHWICQNCSKVFGDEDCTMSITNAQLAIPSLEHKNMVHNEARPINGTQNGQIEHWYCEDCDGYFLDENGTELVTKEDVTLFSAINIPDFTVEIPEGRDPVVLQLSDTQIIDGAQSRPDKSEGDKTTYATSKIKEYCYDYLTETITKTKPDFIIITGDLVYGEYDDNGSVFKAFVEFMDSFQIYWSPVFGNHEAESKMGIDWQCEQLENSEYCLFEQKTLTGNGNYSVGLVQGGEIKRVFYMLDTNGCSNASQESLQNGHTIKTAGLASDQIEWYTNQINTLKALSPQTKISFAYHIQQAVFGDAFAKYGFDQNTKYQNIFVDYAANNTDGDFGYIGRQMKDPWDASKKVYENMKILGVDSIFVGHEHCNSASVVYEGIRFQYGQKSSEYDRYNAVNDQGEIVAIAIWNKTGTPLVGGSVIVLSETDGAIKDSYIYYCKNAGGKLDWDSIGNKQ